MSAVFLFCVFIGAFYINSGIIDNNEGDTISSKCIRCANDKYPFHLRFIDAA